MTTLVPPLNPTVSTHTRAVMRSPLTLSTHIGVKTYNRTFKRLEAALFLADVLVLLRGRASHDYAAEITQVHSAMDQELTRLSALVTAEQQWITKALKVAPRDAEVQYTDPVTLNLTLRTPRARPYVTLLTRLEQTLCSVDQAWYHGLIPTAEQLKRGNLLFRHFYRACGVIERLAWGLGRRVHAAEAGAVPVNVSPDYQAMLLKRTGRGLDQAAVSETTAPDEAVEAMTAEESASLEATEALVASLTPVVGENENAFVVTDPEAQPDDANGAPSLAPLLVDTEHETTDLIPSPALESPLVAHPLAVGTDTSPLRLRDAFRRREASV